MPCRPKGPLQEEEPEVAEAQPCQADDGAEAEQPAQRLPAQTEQEPRGKHPAATILVGDLSVKQMPKSKQATPAQPRTQNAGHLSRFIGFLTYKAALAGKRVIKVDEQYTTKTCCVCGAVHEMPLWKRVMDCACGNCIDRDHNSAVNIMVRFLSQNALWAGYRQFAGNLRQTGRGSLWSPGTRRKPLRKRG